MYFRHFPHAPLNVLLPNTFTFQCGLGTAGFCIKVPANWKNLNLKKVEPWPLLSIFSLFSPSTIKSLTSNYIHSLFSEVWALQGLALKCKQVPHDYENYQTQYNSYVYVTRFDKKGHIAGKHMY